METLLKFLSEANGVYSSTRLNSLLCVLAALILIFMSVFLGEKIDSQYIYALFGYAGLTKTIAKFAEK